MEYKVNVNLNLQNAEVAVENSASLMLRMMMEDTHRLAEPVTPKKEGFLRGGVTKQMVSNNKAIMRWAMNYAAAQEEGGRTDPRTGKYIQFVNYTTPGTHAHYIQESVEKVMNNIPKYLELGGLN